jgi:hypothetical protein
MFLKNTQISIFLKIRLVEEELFHSEGRKDGRRDGQTDGKTGRHDEANCRFSQFFERSKNGLRCEINWLTSFPVLLHVRIKYLLSITRLTDSWAICCMLYLLKLLLAIDKLNV